MPYFFESSQEFDHLDAWINPQTLQAELKLYLKYDATEAFKEVPRILTSANLLSPWSYNNDSHVITMALDTGLLPIEILRFQHKISPKDYSNIKEYFLKENSLESRQQLLKNLEQSLASINKGVLISSSLDAQGLFAKSSKQKSSVISVKDRIDDILQLSENVLVLAGYKHIYFYDHKSGKNLATIGPFFMHEGIKLARLTDTLLMYAKNYTLFLYDVNLNQYVDQYTFSRSIECIEKMSDHCFAIGHISCDFTIISIKNKKICVDNILSRGLVNGGGYVVSVKLSETTFICGYPDNQLWIWDILSGESKKYSISDPETFNYHENSSDNQSIRALIRLADTIFVTRSFEGTVRVWDISQSQVHVNTFKLESPKNSEPTKMIALDDKHMACVFYTYQKSLRTDSKHSKLRVYDVYTGECTKEFDHYLDSEVSVLSALNPNQIAIVTEGIKLSTLSIREANYFTADLKQEEKSNCCHLES